MTIKWIKFCLVILNIVGVFGTASAQQSADPLVGYWKQKQDSVYIKVVNANGRYEAEMIRNDWSPGLVGSTFFHNVVEVKRNNWAGEMPISGSDRQGTATLKINRSGELRSNHRPGGRAVWIRSDPVEKRY